MKPVLRFASMLLPALLTTMASSAATPDLQKTRIYIDRAWDTLTRSMDDCASLVDPKVPTRPVIYLPKDLPMPASVERIKQSCNADVRVLPQVINQLGDFSPEHLPVQGLLYLPKPYVVPGGFFNEMYGWDSYFIVLGLVADHRAALARGIVDNFLFEIEHYGAVLNANRTYYLSRSQPPFLAEMMRAVLDDPASFHSKAEAHAWLAHAYPLALRDYATWTRKEHRAGDTGLARYFDLGTGPVLEMRNSDYLRGVIDWLLAHPSEDPGYLIKAAEHPDDAEAARLKVASCDVRTSAICAGAWSKGYRLRADYYLGDRAMRESGFDTNFHFGPFGGSTHHYAPVDLNSLLYRYERDLHDFAIQLGLDADAQRWAHAADARKAAIDKYLWRPELGMYRDYDFVAGKPSAEPYLTTFYPLWAGVASPEQASAVRAKLPLFERMGGLAMSQHHSGVQWDEPFGWAPTNWLAVAGLDAYGLHDNADVKVSAGYTENVIGFGWTNGVYLKLQNLLATPPSTAHQATEVH